MNHDEPATLEVLWVDRSSDGVVLDAQVLTLSTHALANDSTVANLVTLIKSAVIEKVGSSPCAQPSSTSLAARIKRAIVKTLGVRDLIIHDLNLNGVALGTLPPTTPMTSLLPQLRVGYPRFVVTSRFVARRGGAPIAVLSAAEGPLLSLCLPITFQKKVWLE